mmetsp:Transcript_96590/g.171744  ORF Transcript_96590/g.171744 Transcript_96590/m.171744 type:complete len:262 (+) Transcript_96590:461-1246(+)
MAQQLRRSSVVSVQIYGDAAWSVAMATCIDEACFAHRPVVGDGVNTITVRAIRAGARACCARCWLVLWPSCIARNRLPTSKGRWNVVLTSIGFSLIVDPFEVCMRSSFARWCKRVLLEPEADLHMVPQELGPDLLICIKHDALMATATQAAHVGLRIASWIPLLQEVSVWFCNAPLHKLGTACPTTFAQLCCLTRITNAGGKSRRRKRHLCRAVGLVISKGLRVPNGGNQVHGSGIFHVKTVVIGRQAVQASAHHDGSTPV